MMYMGNISDTLTLYNGVKIPGLGFGVWQISPLHTAKCVKMAIKAGYRNIDTAEGYMNDTSERCFLSCSLLKIWLTVDFDMPQRRARSLKFVSGLPIALRK